MVNRLIWSLQGKVCYKILILSMRLFGLSFLCAVLFQLAKQVLIIKSNFAQVLFNEWEAGTIIIATTK